MGRDEQRADGHAEPHGVARLHELRHLVSPYEENQLVQTVGDGSVAVKLPMPVVAERLGDIGAYDSGPSAATSGGDFAPTTVAQNAAPDDAESLLRGGGVESEQESRTR